MSKNIYDLDYETAIAFRAESLARIRRRIDQLEAAVLLMLEELEPTSRLPPVPKGTGKDARP